ncbi:MAG: formylglycine-generating enzyme family protein [Gammaproteobacteria bacterium]|nr:formylglycine-generating enzyme family protein [Gammaproteobacteria bacterium]
MIMITRFIFLIITLVIVSVRPSYGVAGFDLVTMKNGDYHHGTVAHEIFTLTTSYGQVAIPYLMMARLNVGHNGKPSKILTHRGEHFSGELASGEIIILRDQQPTLPLHTEDMAEVIFTKHKIRQPRSIAADFIEISNGDRFLATLTPGDLLLKAEDSIHHIFQNDIYLIDFETTDQNKLLTQVTLNSGEIRQGQLVSKKSFEVKTQYGQDLSIPVQQLSMLAYHVNFQNQTSINYHYRRHITPANLLQDKMIDGTPGPELIVIRGGDYIKGDIQGDGDSDERPTVRHKLKPFAIGMYEVTFDQYDQFCNDTRRTLPSDSGWGRGQRPVINVSWEDAMAYTKWLSRKTRKTYRLPSDSEWEYAGRAGSKTRFWWGNEVGYAHANCEGCGSLWDGEKTARVGKFLPNAYGLHDTAGNVFEWVADCLHTDFSKAPIDGTPLDKAGCGKRVIRGGAWSFPAKESRSANRWRDFPTRQSDDTGFRVVREL